MGDSSRQSCGNGEGLTSSRWMPPHLVHRMVQYSDPARPPMTRSTASPPPHCGQLDSTVSGSGVGRFEFGFRHGTHLWVKLGGRQFLVRRLLGRSRSAGA